MVAGSRQRRHTRRKEKHLPNSPFLPPFYTRFIFLVFSPSRFYQSDFSLGRLCLDYRADTRSLRLGSDRLFARSTIVSLPFADVIVRLLLSVSPSPAGFSLHLFSSWLSFSLSPLSNHLSVSLSLSFHGSLVSSSVGVPTRYSRSLSSILRPFLPPLPTTPPRHGVCRRFSRVTRDLARNKTF